MGRVVISDTACLIALDKIGQLQLLRLLYGSVFITPTIAAEFHGLIPDWMSARRLFEKLRETDFWISDKFFHQLLAELGK